MRRLFCAVLFVGAISPALAQQATVKVEGFPQGTATHGTANPDKLTIRECLGILAGLNSLDGQRVIIAKGKPTESVETVPYKFGSSPDRSKVVRNAISHNIFTLGSVQQEAQVANRRAIGEIGKGAEIRPGSREAIEFDQQMAAYTDRPCNVELDHIPEADLRLGENDIPGSVLALLWKVVDRQ